MFLISVFIVVRQYSTILLLLTLVLQTTTTTQQQHNSFLTANHHNDKPLSSSNKQHQQQREGRRFCGSDLNDLDLRIRRYERWLTRDKYSPESPPPQCRLDVCDPVNSTSSHHGDFPEWDYAVSGDFSYSYCTYGSSEDRNSPGIAYRQCHSNLTWGPVQMGNCAWSSEVTQGFQEALCAVSRDGYILEDELMDTLNKLRTVIQKMDIFDHPTSIETEILIEIFEILSNKISSREITQRVIRSLMWVVDSLLAVDLNCDEGKVYYIKIVKLLEVIAENVRLPADVNNMDVLSDSMELRVLDVTNVVGEYEILESRHSLSNRHRYKNITIVVNTTLIHNNNNDNNNNDISHHHQEDGEEADDRRRSRIVLIVYYSDALFNVIGNTTEPKQITPVVYTSYTHSGRRITTPISVTFLRLGKLFNEECSYISLEKLNTGDADDDGSELEWQGVHEDTQSSDNGYSMTCSDRYSGYYVIRGGQVRYHVPVLVNTEIELIIDSTISVDVLVGYPPDTILGVIGYLGHCLSFAGLLMTLLSYGAFPNLRKGRPTKILACLCVSIMCYIIVMITTSLYTESTIGCRVALVMTIYFILSSLMWNAVEGFNIYLSLIRVFHDGIEYFMLKCMAVAFGVPAVILGVPLAVDVDNFTGTYEGCTWICKLPLRTMYIVLLTPIIILTIINGFVFFMAMRVLANAPFSQTKKSFSTQLRGAISLLVLLGLAWLFSAFGVANHSTSGPAVDVTTKIFQVIYIIGVSLQGFFIFIFHCVRHPEFRRTLSSAIFRSQTSTTDLNSSSRKYSNTTSQQLALSDVKQLQSSSKA